MVRRVGFSSLYTFLYSPREGTRAAKMPDPVPPEEKSKWFQELCAEQEKIAAAQGTARIGTSERVLVEGTDAKTGLLQGRTDGNLIVDFRGNVNRIGQFAEVEITSAGSWILHGRPVESGNK